MEAWMENQPPPYSIQEVSLKLKIPKHTLRFWEKEFKDILVPLRTGGGQRRYSVEHVTIIKRIKKLREKGRSLSKIYRALSKIYNGRRILPDSEIINSLADRVAEVARAEVYKFFETERGEMLK